MLHMGQNETANTIPKLYFTAKAVTWNFPTVLQVFLDLIKNSNLVL